jgi:hypothetical protein
MTPHPQRYANAKDQTATLATAHATGMARNVQENVNVPTVITRKLSSSSKQMLRIFGNIRICYVNDRLAILFYFFIFTQISKDLV